MQAMKPTFYTKKSFSFFLSEKLGCDRFYDSDIISHMMKNDQGPFGILLLGLLRKVFVSEKI